MSYVCAHYMLFEGMHVHYTVPFIRTGVVHALHSARCTLTLQRRCTCMRVVCIRTHQTARYMRAHYEGVRACMHVVCCMYALAHQTAHYMHVHTLQRCCTCPHARMYARALRRRTCARVVCTRLHTKLRTICAHTTEVLYVPARTYVHARTTET